MMRLGMHLSLLLVICLPVAKAMETDAGHAASEPPSQPDTESKGKLSPVGIWVLTNSQHVRKTRLKTYQPNTKISLGLGHGT